MIACHLELYEENEVKHINGVWPVFFKLQLCLQLKIEILYTKHNLTIKPPIDFWIS